MSGLFPSRSKRALSLVLGVAAATLAAAAPASALKLVAIAGPSGVPFKSQGGFGPTFVASPPGDTHRVFVGTKDGYVYVIVDGVLQPTPFLDLHTRTDTYNENGLFSIAFAPDYATSRRFYVNYSDLSGGAGSNEQDHHIVSFQTSAANPNVADMSSERAILTVPALASCGSNSSTSPHYGGQLQFGPDGHLWVAIGDGGDGCGYQNNATDLTNLYGKLLRIDPQPGSSSYTVPADNPLVGQGGGVRSEIWAYGLRNPWRFSFDAPTGTVVIGDVGNDLQEEIDRVSSSTGTRPRFFGWPCVEGTFVHNASCPAADAAIAPTLSASNVDALGHGGAFCTAVIGGVVLRDPSLAGDYNGRYLYSFFCASRVPANNGRLFTADFNAPAARDEGLSAGFGVSSFGVDACAHPYVTNVTSGGLWRIQGPTPGPCGEHTAPDTTITSAPSGVWKSAGAAFSFASTIEGSSFACSLDGAAAATCPSPFTVTGMQEGWHTLRVSASDEAGNTDASPASAAWVTDTQLPTTTITGKPAPLSAHRAATLAFHPSESDVTFSCALDDKPGSSCSSPVSYKGLARGKHRFVVTATDAAGNVEAAPSSASWTIDTTPVKARLAKQRRFRADSKGRLTIRLRSLAISSTSTLSLRRGARVLARTVKFKTRAKRSLAAHVTLSKASLRSLRRHHSLRARVRVVVTGANGRRSRATTLIRLTVRS